MRLQGDRKHKSTNVHSRQEPWIIWVLHVGTKLYVSGGQEPTYTQGLVTFIY